MDKLICFEDIEAVSPAGVGHKYAALAHAFRAGFAVPPAVAVSTSAHLHFLRTQTWPDGLIPGVKLAADRLGLKETGLSVRSSGTLEDLVSRSFAGQYQSFLKINDTDELIEKIEMCWRSAENKNVKSYLASTDGPCSRAGESGEAIVPAMGVILQQMVPAKAAGVAFGRDPMQPARRVVVIEAVEGLGEVLVSGCATPYRVEVEDDGAVQSQSPPLSGGLEKGGLMDNRQWRAIATMVRSLESLHNNDPLDIEWAIDMSGKLWLLQVRRITFLHHDGEAPQGVWTRKIADDLWADRLTPFLAEVMLRNAPDFDLSTVSKKIGTYVDQENLAVIHGYLYVNCESLRHQLSFIPPGLRLAELKSMFPPSYDLERIPIPSVKTLLRIGLNMLLLPLGEPASVPFICLKKARHFQKRMNQRLEALGRIPVTDAKQAFMKTDQALKIMAIIQIQNQFPYSYATLFTWLLRWLVVDVRKRPHSEFLSSIGIGGRNISITIEREVRHLATLIKRDPGLNEKFISLPTSNLWSELPMPMRAEIEGFLQKYGSRSRHRTLYIARWAEAPEEVLAMLKALVADRKKTIIADGAPTRVVATEWPALNIGATNYIVRLTKPLFRPLQWFARSFLDLREDLRFLLDKALFQIRVSLLETGRFLGMDDQIFFLTRHEIKSLLAQSMTVAAAVAISEERRRRFATPFVPPSFFVDGLPIEDDDEDQETLSGLGTSPGRVIGRARIVTDPFQADIQDGDILIARHTDPGWTPILSRVAGMVVEEGGLLNHCSIVARELGVPTVVGISGATRRIPEGVQVLVDGGEGIVRIKG